MIQKVPCPPTRKALLEHYAQCLFSCELREHKQVFLDEILRLTQELGDEMPSDLSSYGR